MPTLSHRFAQRTNALYPRLVHDDGRRLLDMAPTGRLNDLSQHQYCTVVTFRRNGEPVATPVWFGIAGATLYFRSLRDSGKVRRLQHTPSVLVAPCSMRGRAAGAPFAGTARILAETSDEARVAEAAIQANYGSVRRGYKRAIADAPAVYVAVTPGASGT